MQEINDKQFDEGKSNAFLKGLSDDFRRLREDPEAWQEHEQEIALWNNALADGLESEQDEI